MKKNQSGQEQAAAFVAAARGYKGTPWRHRGRRPWGMDCIGLLVCSAAAAGKPLNDVLRYGREPWDDLLRRELHKQCGEPISPPYAPGDIALIRWFKGQPTHVAIFGDYAHGGLSLIHCENLHGVVEHGIDEYYASVIIEVYRPWLVKSFQ